MTINNLSKTKNIEFLPVYVNDTCDEEPEDVVDLKCGGEVRESARARAREGEREGGREGGREGPGEGKDGRTEGGKQGGRQTDRGR